MIDVKWYPASFQLVRVLASVAARPIRPVGIRSFASSTVAIGPVLDENLVAHGRPRHRVLGEVPQSAVVGGNWGVQ